MANNNYTMAAQEAGRPQPQTTVEAAAGPFIRHSQPGRAPLYQVSGTAYGSIVTQPLVARPGYFRNFRITHTSSGGTVTGGTVAADAPYNVASLIQVKDAFGTPLLVGDSFSISYLVGLYGGSFGLLDGTNTPANLPSYSALTTATNGGFSYSYSLPLEFAKAYGVLSGANASLLPTLQFNFNSFTSLLSGATVTTAPTIQTTVDTDFYWLPEGVNTEPPGLGTTRQWQVVQANPTVSSGGSARVQFPRLGGYLDTIAMIARDSTGARTDGVWPTGRFQIYVDGVPYVDTTMNELYDDMAISYGFNSNIGLTRPTGTVAISRKTSLNQVNLGLLDTGEAYLSTNPATLIEANFSPAGTFSNGPATISVLVGQIVPTGAIIQGLPEL